MICVPGMDRIPAAQYLRMSETLQQFSIDNQVESIQAYAELTGFRIVKTYTDPGRSGLLLAHRSGLQQLLQDVFECKSDYRAILVYDVSRFGRFQDPDEAAHYEFLCKMSGVPIHYCSELFNEAGFIEKSVLKAIKRVMAAEFCRELSAREVERKTRLVQKGFWVGGRPGYALLRCVLRPETGQAQILKKGEWKALRTEREVLVPGLGEEVTCVQRMFQMAIGGMTANEITKELNKTGSRFYASTWKRYQVARILGNSKYAGDDIWGRTTGRLGAPVVRVPESSWVIKRDAFESIVDRQAFNSAQMKLLARAHYKTNEQLLSDLRKLLARKGYIARAIIDEATDLACARTYLCRFGSLRAAYGLIGYRQTVTQRAARFKQMRRLKYKLLQSIADLYPGQTRLVQQNLRTRPILVFDDTVSVSLLLARCLPSYSGLRWFVEPIEAESRLITLLGFWNVTATGFAHFWVLPSVGRNAPFPINQTDPWLQRGRQLRDLGELRATVLDFARREKSRSVLG